MSETADVVVVGGGVVGCSAAYHLAEAGAGRVLLLERADPVGTGSTGACAGGFRFQFSSRINVELSLASVPMIVGFTEAHGLPLDVVQDGYLFLIRDEPALQRFAAAADMQRSLGVDARVLEPAEAADLAPGIAVEGLVGATFCPQDGIADPSGLTQGYATAGPACGRGAPPRRRGRAGSRWRAARVTGVRTRRGRSPARPSSTRPVPGRASSLASAGVELPLEAIPRTVLTTGSFPGVPERRTLDHRRRHQLLPAPEGEGSSMGGRDERPSSPRGRRPVRGRGAAADAVEVSAGGGRHRELVGRPVRDDARRHPIIGRRRSTGCGSRTVQRPRVPARAGGGQAARRDDRGRRRAHRRRLLGLDRFARGDLVAEAHVV